MKYEQRRYQQRAIENFLDWLPSSDDRLGTMILPTGTGKTFCASMSIKNAIDNNYSIKLLWVAHREELIDQARKTLHLFMPSLSIDIEMAEKRANSNVDIIVGSVQTLHRKRKNMKNFVPNLIVIDE